MRVGILGAGIMGASLAILLARRGAQVTVFDRETVPVGCASRWNEGKIHLGYMYAADPSLGTARAVIPGGVCFARIMEELIGSSLAPHTTQGDDLYLLHRDSVVSAAQMHAHMQAVTGLVRQSADAPAYLVDLSSASWRALGARELEAVADSESIVAGFEVPERSVDTVWVADHLGAAMLAESRVTFRGGVTIRSATPVLDAAGPWRVQGSPDVDERFDVVVNALWEGRLEIDATAGMQPEGEWLHRFRLALFVRTVRPERARSALVCVGPFGDLKSYDDRRFYLSWYPVGLRSEDTGLAPQAPEPLTAEEQCKLVGEVGARLGALVPAARDIIAAAEQIDVRGGYVFAKGGGSLSDAASSLHRRDRFGVARRGTYLSVDTGKYSTAPWLACQVAAELCGEAP